MRAHRSPRRWTTVVAVAAIAAATLLAGPAGSALAADPAVRTFDDEPLGDPPADCQVSGDITVAAAAFGGAGESNRAMRIVDETDALQSQATCGYPETAEVYLGFDVSLAAFDNAFIFGVNGPNADGTDVNTWRLSLSPRGENDADAILQAYDGSSWQQLGYLAGIGADDRWSSVRVHADSENLQVWVDGTRFTTTAQWHPSTALSTVLFASSGRAPAGMDFYVDNLLRTDQRPADWPSEQGLAILPFDAPQAQLREPLTDVDIAQFSGGDGTGPTDYQATVDWGEGAGPETATVTGPDPDGRFTVTGSHTYTELGSQVLTVRVTDADGTSVARSVLVNITRPLITLTTEDAEHNVHFPDVIRLESGRILAAYYAGGGHIDPDGFIKVLHSDDNGQTWSQPTVAADYAYDERDPKLVQLSDGTILLSYFQTEWHDDGSRTQHGVFVVRSTDGGATWSQPTHINGNGYASHGPIVELDNGDLLAPLYGTAPGDTRSNATVARSTDGGHTWRAEDEVIVAAGENFDFQEPNLSVLDDGEIVAVIRTTASPVVAYLARSFDNGYTWTPAQPTDIPAESHHQLLTSDGSILLTYGDVGPGVSGRPTSGVLIGDPHGSWDGHHQVPIYDSGHGDQANPSSVQIDEDTFLTLGYNVVDRTLIGVYTTWADYRDPANDLAVAAEPDLTVSTAQVGTDVTVATATGVFGNAPETLSATVDWGDGNGQVDAAITDQDADGSYRITAASPYTAAGDRTATVTVTDRSMTAEATVPITVVDSSHCDGLPGGPTCTVSPAAVEPTGRITVTLEGFDAGQRLMVVLGTDHPSSRPVKVSGSGDATVRLVVPHRTAPGSYQLWVIGNGVGLSAPFTVAG